MTLKRVDNENIIFLERNTFILRYQADFTVHNKTDLIISVDMRRTVKYLYKEQMKVGVVVRNNFIFILNVLRAA